MKITLTQEEITEILLKHVKSVLISTDIHPLEDSDFFEVFDEERSEVIRNSVEFVVKAEDKS